MDYDKDKYTLNMEDILSKLNIEIPKGYIEVKRAKNDSKKTAATRKQNKTDNKTVFGFDDGRIVHILFLKK